MSALVDTIYGRRGGGWAAPVATADQAHVQRVHARGGPLDGLELAVHSYGPVPVAVLEMPVAGGTYRLAGGTYEWVGPR